ncbi:hypothetical protein YPPY54_2943, partial [Yersinia pestis PY-54]
MELRVTATVTTVEIKSELNSVFKKGFSTRPL